MKRGIVSSVKTNENGLVIATVQTMRAGVTKECMVLHSFDGEAQSLSEDTAVIIEKTDDELWVVVGVLSTDPSRVPADVSGEERVMKFDDGTEISARKDGSGGYDVTIKASGDVTIGADSESVSLAVQDHTHPESGGGTTGTPNEDGTATQVE